MRVIKSDGRRRFFKQGLTTILEFDTDFQGKMMRGRVTDYCKSRFGPSVVYETKTYNENYRIQFYGGRSRKSKIYLRDEHEVTLMLRTLDVA